MSFAIVLLGNIASKFVPLAVKLMSKQVIILGAYGLGKVALEILQQNDVVVYGFLDDDQKLWGKLINEVPVLGSTKEGKYLDLIDENCGAFVAIAHPSGRQQVEAMLYE